MQDRTINNALLALRKQIIRGNLNGLEHVEALLAQRGVSLPRVLPPKRLTTARYCEIRLIILGALRDGPKTMPEIAAIIAGARGEADCRQFRNRVSQALYKMKVAGMVRRDVLWHIVR